MRDLDRRGYIDAEVSMVEKGKPKDVRVTEVLGRRANKGTAIVKRDRFTRIASPPLVVPSLEVS